MRTVGQILREERERKFYTLDEIEKATKIRRELLEALESDNFTKLPPATFVQGFIKNYGKFLGLDTNKLLAIFRREFSDRRNPPRIMESFSNPIPVTRFRLTPTQVISTVVIVLVLIFFGYLWFEYRSLVGAPVLEVTQPADQQTFDNPSIEVAGKTNSEAKVTINNQEVGVDSEGKFSAQIKLSDQADKITITSTSKFGQKSTVERTVFLKQ